jgi:hypothetical protein
MAPPQSPLAPARSTPASSGFYEPSARSQGGFPADSSFWRARNQAGDSLGSPGFGDSLLPRSDNFNSPAAPPQQLEQRRSFREFEKPRFPGQ